LEFGMRRAQGPDGALSASRAAYIGGCEATSNVLAGKLFDIPVRGTHGHSWVTAFADEMAAFDAYIEVMPNNCVLLVDTYNTLTGVTHAIAMGKKLKARGKALLGIRLDSGDLAKLSIAARKMLDDAGFTETKIVASNSLDEYVIARLQKDGAQIGVWGVGTHLTTAYDHAALDGVYKLTALRDVDGHWQYKIKLSEQAVKVSNPGIYQVRRFIAEDHQVMDVLYDVELGIPAAPEMTVLDAEAKIIRLDVYDQHTDLLQPIFRAGKYIAERESIHLLRTRAMQQVAQFVKAFPDKVYPVGLEKNLGELKATLIKELSAANPH
jgi:nicotinate phosphoribosyltransferase